MAGDDIESNTIPPIKLDPIDIQILKVFAYRGPTYHINVSKTLEVDIGRISRRCKALANRGLLERLGRTYFGLTDEGNEFLARRRSVSEVESAEI